MRLAEVLLLGCVCAAVKAAGVAVAKVAAARVAGVEVKNDSDFVPAQYKSSLDLLRRNSEFLLRHLPYENLVVTDPRRHYVIIAGVLACVVEYLNSDCTPPDYEHEFLPAVDRLLPIVWQDPRVAVEKLHNFVADANKTVSPVQSLVDYHCKHTSDEVCDFIIAAIASSTHEYDYALDLLILLGELGEEYEKNRFTHEAEHFEELKLLLTGQQKLKPLVYKAAEVYNKMYGNHCEP